MSVFSKLGVNSVIACSYVVCLHVYLFQTKALKLRKIPFSFVKFALV